MRNNVLKAHSRTINILISYNCNWKIIFFPKITLLDKIDEESEKILNAKYEQFDKKLYTYIHKTILLVTLDNLWREHINVMDNIKTGINLRAYGQKDPLTEYKKEGFNYYNIMLARIRHRVVYFVLRSKLILQ